MHTCSIDCGPCSARHVQVNNHHEWSCSAILVRCAKGAFSDATKISFVARAVLNYLIRARSVGSVHKKQRRWPAAELTDVPRPLRRPTVPSRSLTGLIQRVLLKSKRPYAPRGRKDAAPDVADLRSRTGIFYVLLIGFAIARARRNP